MNTPPIEQQVTFLYTQNLAETAAFYENVLGLPLALDQGSCRIYAVCGTSFLGFCRRGAVAPGARAKQGGVIVTLVTQDVDAWHAYLQEHDVEIEKPPSHHETYNIYQMFVRDPNGYLLEFQTFLDPDWPAPAA